MYPPRNVMALISASGQDSMLCIMREEKVVARSEIEPWDIATLVFC